MWQEGRAGSAKELIKRLKAADVEVLEIEEIITQPKQKYK